MNKIEIDKLINFTKSDIGFLEKYEVGNAFIDVGFDDRQGIGLFGKPADVLYSKDNCRFKNLIIEGTGGVFILDGTLSIQENLILTADDAYTFFVITGDLIVDKNFVQQRDTQLLVLGDTKIGGTMWLNLSDAGFTVFRGSVNVLDWCQTNDSVEDSIVTNSIINGKNIQKRSTEYESLYDKFENFEYQ